MIVSGILTSLCFENSASMWYIYSNLRLKYCSFHFIAGMIWTSKTRWNFWRESGFLHWLFWIVYFKKRDWVKNLATKSSTVNTLITSTNLASYFNLTQFFSVQTSFATRFYSHSREQCIFLGPLELICNACFAFDGSCLQTWHLPCSGFTLAFKELPRPLTIFPASLPQSCQPRSLRLPVTRSFNLVLLIFKMMSPQSPLPLLDTFQFVVILVGLPPPPMVQSTLLCKNPEGMNNNILQRGDCGDGNS